MVSIEFSFCLQPSHFFFSFLFFNVCAHVALTRAFIANWNRINWPRFSRKRSMFISLWIQNEFYHHFSFLDLPSNPILPAFKQRTFSFFVCNENTFVQSHSRRSYNSGFSGLNRIRIHKAYLALTSRTKDIERRKINIDRFWWRQTSVVKVLHVRKCAIFLGAGKSAGIYRVQCVFSPSSTGICRVERLVRFCHVCHARWSLMCSMRLVECILLHTSVENRFS